MTVKQRFIEDIKKFSHIYIDVRDSAGFAFYFEGLIKDFYEKEQKLYFNQDVLNLDYGFFSLKLPWEKLKYENYIYTMVDGSFRLSILFINET